MIPTKSLKISLRDYSFGKLSINVPELIGSLTVERAIILKMVKSQ
jgi:hypothetical protein